eukprot:302811_1
MLGCGMIATDGHICKSHKRIQWKLQAADYEMLAAIISMTESNQKITFQIAKNGLSNCVLNQRSEQLANDALQLIPCNWHDKAHSLKSSLCLFEKTGFEYASSYIRGISDGDGSWYFRKAQGGISWDVNGSSREFIEGIRDILGQTCLKSMILPKISINNTRVGIHYRLQIND